MNAVKTQDEKSDKIQKTIAIIQTTRIGDILQTTHAVRLLKENHPNIRVLLVARQKFSSPISFILNKYYDKIIEVNHKSAMIGAESSADALSNLKKQLNEINNEKIDVSINLAFSKSSTYLHTLIKSENKVGPYFNLMHERVLQDKWSQYLYSTVMRGDLNPYNLVDLFGNIIGVNKKLTHLSNKEFSVEEKSHVLIHPFSSKQEKQWTSNRWVEVIYQTLKRNTDVKVILCGSKLDQQKAEEIIGSELLSSYRNRIETWIGLKLNELYARVDQNYLFVGHDSMIGNLLSFKNVKSLTVSVGPVRPHETTPYALDNYNLALRNNSDELPYNVTYQCIEQLLKKNLINTQELHNNCSTISINKVSLFKSDMLANGDLTIKEQLHKEQDAKEVMRNFYHIAWSSIITEANISMDVPNISNEAKTQLVNHVKGIETLFELAEFGKKYSRYIIEEISKNTPSIDEIKKFSAKLDEVDTLSDMIVGSYPLLAPIIDYAKVAKNNLQGTNLVNLSESAFYAYNEVTLLCSVLYEFYEKCSLIKKQSETARDNV